MKKFFNKAKEAIRDQNDGASGIAPSNSGHGAPAQQPLPSQDEAENIQPPHPSEIMRFRYQHGTNLGTVFVLERWLCGSMFADGSPGSAELAGVEGCVKVCGPLQRCPRADAYMEHNIDLLLAC